MPKTKLAYPRQKKVDLKQNRAIRKLTKKVKALEAPIETKFNYEIITQFGINTTATAQTLNLIRPWDSAAPGPSANENRLKQREGQKVSMLRFMLKGKLEIPYPPLDNTVDRRMPTRCRMIYVYYPAQAPGNNIDDILHIPSSPTIGLVDAFYKRNGQLKYKILKDVVYSLEPNYWQYSNPASASTETFSGMTSTKPAFITLRHNFDLSKLPNNGELCFDDQLAVPALGQIVLYTMTDNLHYDIRLIAQTQLTWHDQ